MSEKTIALTEYEEQAVKTFTKSIVRNRGVHGINYLLVPVHSEKDFKRDGAIFAKVIKRDEPFHVTWNREKAKNIGMGALIASSIVGGALLVKRIVKKKRAESE